MREQQAFNERPGLLQDHIVLETLDKLAPTVVAVMILFAVVNVPVFLKLGGLAPWTDVSVGLCRNFSLRRCAV
jgi:hypothetical protein